LAKSDSITIPCPKARHCWLFACIALNLINFSGMPLLWNSGPFEDPDIDTLSVAMTAAEVVLGALAIILGLGAFGGFWLVRRDAIAAAEEEARKTVKEQMEKLLRQQEAVVSKQSESAGSYGLDNGMVNDAEPAGEE